MPGVVRPLTSLRRTPQGGANTKRSMALSVCVISELAALEQIVPDWTSLLERSETNEPALSPPWLLTWWRVFGDEHERRLAVVVLREGGRLVGLAPLLARTHWYAPGIPFRRLELIGSGENEADEICSEYIGILAERGAEEAVAKSLAQVLASGGLGRWDELVLPAMDGSTRLPSILGRALDGATLPAAIEITSRAPFVPLPASWEAYLGSLPSGRRGFIQRSVRDLDRWAEGSSTVVAVEAPQDLARGKRILAKLHAERWAEQGRQGLFESPRFTRFHDELMAALLPRGAIELLWLAARGEPVAAVYSFVWNDKVYFYQSGRKTDVPNRIRPGIVLHAHAIRRAIEAGRREYDFLGGMDAYKMTFALATRPLVQLRAIRPSLRETLRVLARQAATHAQRVQRSFATTSRHAA